MLKVEVVLHFILKKIQNINYLGQNVHLMCVVLAEFLRNSCLSKPQYTITWVGFVLNTHLARFDSTTKKKKKSIFFILNGIVSARKELRQVLQQVHSPTSSEDTSVHLQN